MENDNRKSMMAASLAAACALMLAAIWAVCRFDLHMLENISTFYYDSAWTSSVASQPGGSATLAALCIQQFFSSPAAAAAIAAALMAGVAAAGAFLIRRIAGSWALAPLALAPAGALAMLQCDVNCQLAGAVGFLIALLALLPIAGDCRQRHGAAISVLRASYPILAAAAIFYLAGPAATLFAFLSAIILLMRKGLNVWRIISSATCLLLVWVMGLWSARSGHFSSVAQALTPCGYYTAWMQAPQILWTPWAAITAAVVVASLAGLKRASGDKNSKNAKRSWCKAAMGQSLSLAASAAFVLAVGLSVYDREQSLFHELSVYAGQGQWDKIVRRCQRMPLHSKPLQRCLFLALAQKGSLCDSMFKYPCDGPESIIDPSDKSPGAFMLAADAYYAMGHVSLAQKHAFEANEALGGYSPRLLQRLTDTAIAYGQRDVAAKYLSLLSKTLRYKDWAKSRQQILDVDAVDADPQLGRLRRCIFADNRFAGSQGLASDLREILRANPECGTALQYLGAVLLLTRNTPALVAAIDEFYGTPAHGAQLPAHFQEALAVDALATGSDAAAVRYGVPRTVAERAKACFAYNTPAPGTYWEYLKSNRARTNR